MKTDENSNYASEGPTLKDLFSRATAEERVVGGVAGLLVIAMSAAFYFASTRHFPEEIPLERRMFYDLMQQEKTVHDYFCGAMGQCVYSEEHQMALEGLGLSDRLEKLVDDYSEVRRK